MLHLMEKRYVEFWFWDVSQGSQWAFDGLALRPTDNGFVPRSKIDFGFEFHPVIPPGSSQLDHMFLFTAGRPYGILGGRSLHRVNVFDKVGGSQKRLLALCLALLVFNQLLDLTRKHASRTK